EDGAVRDPPRYAARPAPRLRAEGLPHVSFRIARWPRRARGGAHPAEVPPPGRHDTLLRHALGEGIADFLSELAVGPWAANTPRQIYGRAHEHDVWVDFQDEMAIASDSLIRTWMYNGMVPPDKNHGAVDIGYWVGYRIAAAYYARAADKRAAVRQLLELRDPVAVLRESGYAP